MNNPKNRLFAIRRAIAWLLIAAIVQLHLDAVIQAQGQSRQPEGASWLTAAADGTTWPAIGRAIRFDPSAATEATTPVPVPRRGTPASLVEIGERSFEGDRGRYGRIPQPPHVGTRFASTAGQSGGSDPTTGWLVFGLGLGVAGYAMVAYGESDTCAVNNPRTNVCKGYLGTGVGMFVGGVIMALAAAAASKKGTQQAGGGTYTPPTTYVPPPPPRQPAPYVPASPRIETSPQGPQGQLPPPQISGRCAGVTTLEIENRTAYTLTVWVSGTDAWTYRLNPGASQSARLNGGQYRVQAEVTASNVNRFAGNWNLTGGCPYAYYFFLQPQP
jgi:hypothetical protein